MSPRRSKTVTILPSDFQESVEINLFFLFFPLICFCDFFKGARGGEKARFWFYYQPKSAPSKKKIVEYVTLKGIN